MSTDENYKEYVLETVIKQLLLSGQSPTTEAIDSAYDAFVAGKDFTQPLFDSTTSGVVQLESATATKINSTYGDIFRDLLIGYQTTFAITDKCVKAFDRWRAESIALESKLKILDDRISNLITTQVHIGSHYVSDVFADTTKIDMANTTAYVNIKDNNVSLNASDESYTRINLNRLLATDSTFIVLSRGSLQNSVTAQNAGLVNAFLDTDGYWQTRVYTSSAGQPITGELKFKISDTPISISKISVVLHSANTNSPVQITPMISTDGINFLQIDAANITTSVTDRAAWTFPATEATHIKMLMTKNGYDFLDSNQFIYEFGAQEIAVYNTGFDNQHTQTIVSTALSANDTNGNPIPFHSVQLETCDVVPEGTDIQYWIAALTNADDREIWTPVDPLGLTDSLYPSQINFGQKRFYEVPNAKVSFDAAGATGFANPAADYTLISVPTDYALTYLHTSTVTKYVLSNPSDRILTHELDGSLDVSFDNINIFRNVGTRGTSTLIRNIQAGWTFEEPYYVSAIEVLNPNGIKMNFGDKPIILDGDNRSGIVLIEQGIHTIKIRKENWINVSPGIFSLEGLKSADPLFPYNHKLLIEGYTMTAQNNPYVGVDTFAGYYLRQASIVDFNNNVEDNDYTAFAIDTDAVDTNKPTPSLVFMVKSDASNSDFLDELFTIRFTLATKTFNYVKFKAKFTSTDETISPVLASYKLKLSN